MWKASSRKFAVERREKKQEPPTQKRIRLEDVTIEAAQEVLRDSPSGVLCLQDELAGWFGAMDKYSGNRGSAKDRGFWLQAYNGGNYLVNRISRGAFIIPNLSICALGGIQPDLMRKVAGDGVDDGLLQRLCPIMLRPAAVGRDEQADPVVMRFGELVENLHTLQPPRDPFNSDDTLRFDEGAQALRHELEQKHIDLQACEAVNRKLGSHIGKYDGLFARLCVVWHCIENVSHKPLQLPRIVTGATAQRVAEFLHGFLLPHAIQFYVGTLGLADDHERLAAVAGYILAHKLDRITNRHIQRGDRTMRKLTRRDTDQIFEQLEALGWVERIPGKKPGSPPVMMVNPEVHRRFADRAAAEASRRTEAREAILASMGRRK